MLSDKLQPYWPNGQYPPSEAVATWRVHMRLWRHKTHCNLNKYILISKYLPQSIQTLLCILLAIIHSIWPVRCWEVRTSSILNQKPHGKLCTNCKFWIHYYATSKIALIRCNTAFLVNIFMNCYLWVVIKRVLILFLMIWIGIGIPCF